MLICGAGIAGPALALRLLEAGDRPTLVERAPALRKGGYLIDIWGVGHDLVERMGLLRELRERGTVLRALRFVDARGKVRSELGGEVLRRALGERFFSVPRGELAELLFERVRGRAETIFGDMVTSLEEDGAGVDVVFASGRSRRFDLVVGADGVHSKVRTLLFGTAPRCSRYLGYAVAAFSVRSYPRADPATSVCYASPGRQIGRYTLPDGRTAFLLVFVAPEPLAQHPGEMEADKRVLHAAFGQEPWVEIPEILRDLEETRDLYYDAVTQVELPHWSRGRTVLVGDAAYCPSLLAGEGAAFAMLGAFVLATELGRTPRDDGQALERYEQRLRPFIERKQRAARGFASQFAPRSRLGLWLRDLGMRLMAVPVLGDGLARRLFTSDFSLPDDARPA